MENLYFKEEDKDKVFTACTYQGDEVRGELFHMNGNHFILIDGSIAVKVVPQTVKEFNPTEKDKGNVADEVRSLSETSKDKLIQETYSRIMNEAKERAVAGYTSVVTQVPGTIVASVCGLLDADGFGCKYRIDSMGDNSTLYLTW